MKVGWEGFHLSPRGKLAARLRNISNYRFAYVPGPEIFPNGPAQRCQQYLVLILLHSLKRPVGRAVTRSFLERGTELDLGPVKSNTVLPTNCQHCDISLKGDVLPAGSLTQRWALSIRNRVRRKTGSKIKDLIRFDKEFSGKNCSQGLIIIRICIY